MDFLLEGYKVGCQHKLRQDFTAEFGSIGALNKFSLDGGCQLRFLLITAAAETVRCVLPELTVMDI